MRGQVNDWLRLAIAHCVRIAGLVMSVWQRLRIYTFAANQQRLRRRYNVTLDTPILSYGPEVERSIATAARKTGHGARFALTSGSAGDPKRLLYTNHRLRTLKFLFSDMFARACWTFRLKRTSLYVFSTFERDASLTSMLLEEMDLPNYFTTLQAPYRVQRHPAIRALAAEYGATAVRLWIIAVANPGVIYATNPSTISIFFDELEKNWRESSRLIRTWRKDRKRFNKDVRRIARRLDSVGSKNRLAAIASSDKPVPVQLWAPALAAYICWTGGYLRPFLDRLQVYLPSARYRLIPMYSMSTETIETLSNFEKDDVAFLPLPGGILFEFLDESERVINANELQPGKLYEMIVSNGFGLRRYRTNDLFLCRRKVRGLPDLAFIKRRGLEYSFTGEKLTAEQLTIVFNQLRTQYPRVFAGRFLTCVPSQPPRALPHYKILIIGEHSGVAVHDKELAMKCDELLRQVNCEYRNKRAGGVLGEVQIVETGTKQFAENFSANAAWESQFKFLPLRQELWESGCSHLTSPIVEAVS
ncbi:MAG TPA: GH3 auxin-responsive promoter family protein [Pyrinomonadaceae bacterium]|nr:GH3 auxin-responsive promoter family protein [Pyrinomonadaceae bacterium]